MKTTLTLEESLAINKEHFGYQTFDAIYLDMEIKRLKKEIDVFYNNPIMLLLPHNMNRLEAFEDDLEEQERLFEIALQNEWDDGNSSHYKVEEQQVLNESEDNNIDFYDYYEDEDSNSISVNRALVILAVLLFGGAFMVVGNNIEDVGFLGYCFTLIIGIGSLIVSYMIAAKKI